MREVLQRGQDLDRRNRDGPEPHGPPYYEPCKTPEREVWVPVDPPATGYILPSSACTSARIIIIAAPITQETSAAGPAICDAYRAPKSHPEPMIDPRDTKSNPILLTSLCSLRSAPAPPDSVVCVAITNPPLLAQLIRQHSSMIHVAQLPFEVGAQPCRPHPSRPCRVVSPGDDRLSLPFRCKAVGIVRHRSVRNKCFRGPERAV